MHLAIDTSTNTTGLALITNGHIVAEDIWPCARNQSVELLPHIVSLFASAKSGIRDITGIIVARGPGSFNSLRVGLSTAKGLAFGLNVPIAGISTLAAAAYQHATAGLPVCAVLPAGHAEVAWAVYQELEREWQNTSPETISAPSTIFSYVISPTIFAGEPDEYLVQETRATLGELAVTHLVPPKSRVHALAELGTQRLGASAGDDVATLQPIYLRRPPITQPKSRAAGLKPPPPTVL